MTENIQMTPAEHFFTLILISSMIFLVVEAILFLRDIRRVLKKLKEAAESDLKLVQPHDKAEAAD